ncbi:MAG: LD-carboxypeptidase [Bacteroidales bacterium]
MTTPRNLIKGDKIAILAPAGKINKKIVLQAKKTINGWGLKVALGKHIFNPYFSYSATDAERLEDFQRMLDDPTIKAILCARGGYGSARIIDQLDFKNFKKNPKWIIGFSDITVLHNHILKHYGIETIHGTMAAGLDDSVIFPETSDSLKKVLFGETIKYEWPTNQNSRKGKCTGILTGGNLAILCSLLETPSEVDLQRKILFIEEIGEHLYKIDRMMVQLKRAGKLENLAGLIVGGMTDIPDNKEDFGKTAFEIVKEAVDNYNYPLAFGFPAGHQDDNRALILGRNAALHINEFSILKF